MMEFACLQNKNNIQKDFILATVPWTDSNIPLMAPAVLKPIIEKAGLSCLSVDLNVEIYNFTKKYKNRNDIIRFFFDEFVNNDTKQILNDMLFNIARQIVSFKPKYVGLSIFSYICQRSAKWISYFIKKLDPNVIILVGGAGCNKAFTGKSQFVEDMLKMKLIDFHIKGDAEKSLFEFLQGNTAHDGINTDTWTQISRQEMSTLPVPDYGDYNFDVYEKKALAIVGSRGCVRQCTYCDFIVNWPKFHWRDAEDIFEEMLSQSKKYNIRFFKFQDSLVNGNQKEFLKLCRMLAKHNLENPDWRLQWNGHFIYRESHDKSDDEWRLLRDSGATNLMVGIENLNQHIRFAMGKKFSNKAIDDHLYYAKKYNIKQFLMNIVGYVNEVEEDIDFIKDWLKNHTEYKDVIHLQWGGTLGIFPNTFLDKNKEDLGIEMIGDQPSLWINRKTGSTPQLRARWANELNDLSKKLGYKVADNIDNHYLLETLIA